MFSITEILETIRHDIHLHEKLREMVIEEHRCFEEDNLDCLTEKNRNRVKLEKEIKNSNKAIVTMLSKSNVDSKDVDAESLEKVTLLVNKLRESIKYNMSVVEEAVENIENKKDETVKHLKTLKKGKIAINSYARYETI